MAQKVQLFLDRTGNFEGEDLTKIVKQKLGGK